MCWFCDNPEAGFDDYVVDVVVPTIEQRGWAVQAVGPRGQRDAYAYTVGLTASSRAELVVTGKSPETAYDLLEAAVDEEEPRAGFRYELLTGPTLQVLRARTEPLAVATRLYGERVRALQLVWADGRGRWPWEVKQSRQWLLGRPSLPESRAG